MEQNAPKHILIIEDDAFFSELLARNLLQKNFRVTAVPRVEDAEELLKGEGYDVACFDIVVSGSDGMKSLSEIKTSGFFKNTPPVLLIDRGQEEAIREWVNEDTVEYIIKNESSPDEIAVKIETLAAK